MVNMEDIFQRCNLQIIDLEIDNKEKKLEVIRKGIIESFPSIDKHIFFLKIESAKMYSEK